MADLALLWLPMQVDALRLEADLNVVAPASFDRLPYTAGGLDYNIGAPFLAQTTHPAPFQPPTHLLGRGVHLHWTLPQALRTQTHRRDAAGKPLPNTLEFPLAPDQWRIERIVKGAVETTWRIDSGFVWTPDASGGFAPESRYGSIWPWKLVKDETSGARRYEINSGDLPYRWVGRRWKVGEPKPDRTGERLDAVRADGWGDPTFAAYYPACRGLFGFWDETPVDDATYRVVGWYGNEANDPLRQLHAEALAKPLDELISRWGFTFEGASEKDATVPSRMVCVGLVDPKNHTKPAAAHGSIELRVALANTGVEAVAALLAHDLRPGQTAEAHEDAERLERQLDAVLFAKHLDGHEVDVGERLDELRHERGFGAFAGGTCWVLREMPGDGEAAAEVALSDTLVAEVDALNAAQEALERAEAVVQSRRADVYADWYRAIKLTDPEEAGATDWVRAQCDPSNRHTADIMYQHLVREELPALRAAIEEERAARSERDIRLDHVRNAVIAHNRQEGASPWTLDSTPARRFYAPNDPVVALLPDENLSTDRGAGEGLPHDEHGRLVGWKVVGTLDCTLDSEPGSIPDEVAKTLQHPGLCDDHVHLLAMEWRAQFGADEVGPDDDTADYPIDWLASRSDSAPVQQRQAAEVISGRAFLVPGADDIVERSLFDYVHARLSERCVAAVPSTEGFVEVHPVTAVNDPPVGMIWLSWAEVWHDKVQGHAPEGGMETLVDEALVENHAEHIRVWAREQAMATAWLAAAKELQAWPAIETKDGAKRVWGLQTQGAIAQAIVKALQSSNAADLEQRLDVPADVARRLATAANADLAAIDRAAGPYRWVVAASLYREMEKLGLLRKTIAPVPGMADTGQWFGLPDGGVLATTLCACINVSTDETLLFQVGLNEDVVGRLLEARPFSSLADLAALPCLHVDTIAKLVAFIDDTAQVFVEPPTNVQFQGIVREDPLSTVLDAWFALRRQPRAWTHSLDGFHDALLQWDPGPQLPVADPVGFPDYRTFADDVVAPAVGDAPRRAPRPDTGFHPLRAGLIALDALRLIDSFGVIVRELDQDALAKVIVPATRRPPASGGWHGVMPARITQPARLDLRWCADATSAAPWTPHPNTSPIRGWIAADDINGSLSVYRSDGELLGAVARDGWRMAPGRSGPLHPADIEDTALRGLVLHLLRNIEAEPDVFLDKVLDIIDEALDNIHPPTTTDEEALTLLVSRPLAVVRCRIAIDLDGPSATRQDGATTNSRSDRRFGDVRVPLQVGAHHHLRDGVVVWWEEDAQFAVTGEPHVPLHDSHDLALPIVDARGPHTLLLLVDPMGAVHVVGDCLPMAKLELPATSYVAAVRHMEVCTFSGPHLCPAGQMRLPVPHVSGWSTSFRLREPHGWRDIDTRDQVDLADLAKQLPEDTDVTSLWNRLIADGILVETQPGAERGWIVPPPPQHPLSLEERLASYSDGAALARILQTHAYRLATHNQSHSGQPHELREGWLWLRRNS